MTELNIKEYDLVADVRTVNEEILTEDKKVDAGVLFFGDIDIPMQEIDAAIRKLEELSRRGDFCIAKI